MNKKSFFYKNSLSIVFLTLTILCLAGQAWAGWFEFNEFLKDHGQKPVDFDKYLTSGHFLQATFENWESEFLQMALFVWLTVFLRQKGSSESKSLDGEEDVDKEPKKHAKAPWPVKKGGWILSIYKHSLSIALLLLFIVSFVSHWIGSYDDFSLTQRLKGKPGTSIFDYLFQSRIWFESFQNWQSEFLSVFAIVFLSIYLREKGSPQSKPVDAPHEKTGG
jgi:hypothetical protein